MERDRNQNNTPSSLFSNSFYMAPLCRLAICGSIGSYVIMSFPAAKYLPLLRANIENVVLKKELWRLPLSKLCFTDAKQLVLCVVLMLNMKKFEKRFGTRKFASYVCSIFLLTLVMEFILLYASYKKGYTLDDLANGPLGIIFSLFIPFYLDIPRIERAYLLGIPITGKAIVYICGLQICSSSVETLCSSLIGIVAGALYRSNCCYIRTHLRIPPFVGSVFHKLFSPIFGVSQPPARKNYGATLDLQRLEEEDRMEQALLMADMRAQRNQHDVRGGLRAWLGGRRDRQVAPSEDTIQTLTNMGFGRDRAVEALRLCNNDLAQATNHLLASNR